MKTSISSRLLPSTLMLSRSKRIVDAGRVAVISAISLPRRARLRLKIGALVEPRHARQQIIDLSLRRGRDHGARLALRAGGNDAALLEHVFPHREAGARLLLVAD